MIIKCGTQLRIGGMGSAFGLDFGAIMSMGQALDVDIRLLADVLPGVERAIILSMSDDEGGSDDG